MPAFDTPLALIGYTPHAARALRDLGLVAVAVPTDDLGGVLEAGRALRFTGALVHSSQETHAFDHVTPDAPARRVGRVDAVAFSGNLHGTFAQADALTDVLNDSGYASRGASAVVLGQQAGDLALALPLARLGFTELGVVAASAPDAERAARDVPAGVRVYPLSRRDSSVNDLAGRADLIVLTAGELPHGLVQPYHTVIDLTGHANVSGTGASSLDLRPLPLRRLARQLAHATGQRFQPHDLEGALHALD